MNPYCKIEGCERPVENRDTGLCATHAHASRKEVKAPIKRVSDKLSGELDEYSIKREAFLKAHPRCAVYYFRKATTIHHSRGRGKYLMDESTWIPCSMEGHTRIELNPQWAREKGFTKSRLTNETKI